MTAKQQQNERAYDVEEPTQPLDEYCSKMALAPAVDDLESSVDESG
jgi:hypothetical protein